MTSILIILLTALFCGLYLNSHAAISPATLPAYQVADKEIYLKHGKFHLHEDAKKPDDDEHLVYRYRWLEDDIVKTEDGFEGDEESDEEEEFENEEKKIKLPGGCELTENQYLELESFKKETQYVKKCYCEQGGVYCQLNKALFKQNLT